MSKPKTMRDFLNELEKANSTVAEWARRQDVDLNTAYAVVRGRVKGRSGEARRIVQAMGLPTPRMFKGQKEAV